MSDERPFDLWVCDNCHLYYHFGAPRHEVRVEQRTERIYGTTEMYRPIERLTLCDSCYTKVPGGSQDERWVIRR